MFNSLIGRGHYNSLETPPQIDNLKNNGTTASWNYNGNEISVSKNDSSGSIKGQLANGDSFDIRFKGDPHATVTITGPDGRVKSTQKFDFKEDSAFKLPDGTLVCVGTKGDKGTSHDKATYADRFAMISPAGEALVVKNMHSKADLAVSTEKIQGDPVDFLNKRVAPDGFFDGNRYQLGASGLKNERGDRVNQGVVNKEEKRNDRLSSEELGMDMTLELLNSGLSPRQGHMHGGMMDFRGLRQCVHNMSEYGGYLPMRDPMGCPVLADIQGCRGMDSYQSPSVFSSHLNQMPPWSPAPSFGMNRGVAAAAMADYCLEKGINNLSLSQLQQLARNDRGCMGMVAESLLMNPEILQSLDTKNGAQQDGRIDVKALLSIAHRYGYCCG